jgi:hypothetical protein
MTDLSARFALPFLLPGQAQKEVFHNEALATIDAALHGSVEEGPLSEPPAFPEPGESWIVSLGASGAWEGRDHALACFTQAGWRFVAPVPGMCIWNKAAGHWIYWSGASWSDGSLPSAGLVVDGIRVVGPRLEAIASPSGGTIIDA